jgi:hypothetical protein
MMHISGSLRFAVPGTRQEVRRPVMMSRYLRVCVTSAYTARFCLIFVLPLNGQMRRAHRRTDGHGNRGRWCKQEQQMGEMGRGGWESLGVLREFDAQTASHKHERRCGVEPHLRLQALRAARQEGHEAGCTATPSYHPTHAKASVFRPPSRLSSDANTLAAWL